MSNYNFSQVASMLWSVADILRGDFKQSQFGRIILPFTLLRRLECVLEPTKAEVLAKYEEVKKRQALVKGYDNCVNDEAPTRRLASTFHKNDIRGWMEDFSQKVVKYLRTQRSI